MDCRKSEVIYRKHPREGPHESNGAMTTTVFQDEYKNAMHGGKWTVENLRLFIESTRGKDLMNLTVQ
jgi:hypothetical protein